MVPTLIQNTEKCLTFSLVQSESLEDFADSAKSIEPDSCQEWFQTSHLEDLQIKSSQVDRLRKLIRLPFRVYDLTSGSASEICMTVIHYARRGSNSVSFASITL